MRKVVLLGALALVLLTVGLFAVQAVNGDAALAIYTEAVASLEAGQLERAAYLLDVLQMDQDFCAYLQERAELRSLDFLAAEAASCRTALTAQVTPVMLLTMPPREMSAEATITPMAAAAADSTATPKVTATAKPAQTSQSTTPSQKTATPKPANTPRVTATPCITAAPTRRAASVPTATPGRFTDMTVDLKLSLFTDTASGKARTQSYSAADIRKYMHHGSHYPYTVYFDFAPSERQRDYTAQITVQAPAGGVRTLISDTVRIAPGETRVYWSGKTFDDYFVWLYGKCGAIPTGSYTLTLYLDGKTADTVSFSVKK